MPPVYAPAPRPANNAVVPAVLLIVAAVMALLALVAPMAAINILGLSVGINIWGISFLGFSVTWWSATGMPPAQMGLLTAAIIMAILGMVLGFVAGGLMFARKGGARPLALLVGIFSILAVVFFWTGLLINSVDSGSSTFSFDIGLSPSIGTFTLIIGAVLSFIGAAKYKPPAYVPPIITAPAGPYPQYGVSPQYQYQYQDPPAQNPPQYPGWPPQSP